MGNFLLITTGGEGFVLGKFLLTVLGESLLTIFGKVHADCFGKLPADCSGKVLADCFGKLPAGYHRRGGLLTGCNCFCFLYSVFCFLCSVFRVSFLLAGT